MNLLRKYLIQIFFQIRVLALLSLIQLMLISLSKASELQSDKIGILEEIPGTRLQKVGNFYISYHTFFFVDKKIGWFTARDRMGTTEDGGKTWQIKSLGLLGEPTHALFFLNKDIGWYADWDRLLRTQDGGKIWKVVSHYPKDPKDNLYQYIFNDLYFINESKGWGISAAELYQTEDGGLTWTKRYEISGRGSLSNIIFVDSLQGWLGGTDIKGPFVLLTKDGGKSWERIDLGNYSLDYLKFLDTNMGWAIGSRRISSDKNKTDKTKTLRDELLIFRTKDGGKTWEQGQLPPETKDMPYVSFAYLYMKDKKEGWAVARGFLLHTIDGGATWKIELTKPEEKFIYVALVEHDKRPTLLIASLEAIYRMLLE